MPQERCLALGPRWNYMDHLVKSRACDGCWFGRWLKITDLTEDKLKLLVLLHVRTSYSAQDWTIFDMCQNIGTWEITTGQIPYNAKCVRICGNDFGRLETFDRDLVHARALIGFPRAYTTVMGQKSLARALRKVVDAIVTDSPATKAGDLRCGQLMRSFCEMSLPKGVKNLSWFTKMTEARERSHKVWQHIRTVFNKRQSSIGRSELFITSVISQMSFDECPKHTARVAAERQEIEKKLQRDSMLGKVQMPLSSQPAWDAGTNQDMGVRRNLTKKTNAARDDGTIEKDLEQLTLADDLTANDDDHQQTSASVPQIAMKPETLRVVSKMFPTGAAEGTSGVRWTELVQALTDAGSSVTQGAGSAVCFTNGGNKIVIHQPHDRDGPVVDAIMLRGIGKRLSKWFGWTNETFVLRERSS